MPNINPFLRQTGRYIPWILLTLWFAMQLPFLTADPDTLLDIHTRGAWTDEGLYSGTARNFLNTGFIDPYENSLYTRGPLFTFAQIPVFFVFGQSLLVARLMVLLFTLFVFVLYFRRKETQLTGIFLLLAGFTQVHLFHFSHYAMAEVLATGMILIALLCLVDSSRPGVATRIRRRRALGAATLLFVAYGLKIQFLYIAFLLPGFALVRMMPHLASGSEQARELRRDFGWSVLVTAGWMVVYTLLWYLPNFDFYNYVMTREVDSRFPETLTRILSSARFNFTELLFVPYLKPLIVAGGTALTGGLLWLIIRPSRWEHSERVFFLLGLLWFIGELHKIPMTYMPHRYLVPAYVSVALMIASVLSVTFREGRWPAVAVVLLVSGMAFWQLRFTAEAYQRRTYDLQAVNRYLKQYDWKGKTITGAWGPSAAWGTKARVFPVWYGFVNDDRALDAAMIIAESDQEDSDRSLKMQGIDLSARADSVRRFPIWRYEADFYWLP